MLVLLVAGLSLARSAEAAAGPNFVFVLAVRHIPSLILEHSHAAELLEIWEYLPRMIGGGATSALRAPMQSFIRPISTASQRTVSPSQTFT